MSEEGLTVPKLFLLVFYVFMFFFHDLLRIICIPRERQSCFLDDFLKKYIKVFLKVGKLFYSIALDLLESYDFSDRSQLQLFCVSENWKRAEI